MYGNILAYYHLQKSGNSEELCLLVECGNMDFVGDDVVMIVCVIPDI